MIAPDITGFGLTDLWNSNPMLKAAGLAPDDELLGGLAASDALSPGSRGPRPVTGNVAGGYPITRKIPSYMIAPEKPTGFERVMAAAMPVIQFMAARAAARGSARRRMLIPGLIASATQGALNTLAGVRAQKERQRAYQQAQEDQQLQKDLVRAQIKELGQRHQPHEVTPETRSLVVEDPNVPGKPAYAIQDVRTGEISIPQLPFAAPEIQMPAMEIPGGPTIPGAMLPGKGTTAIRPAAQPREFAPPRPPAPRNAPGGLQGRVYDEAISIALDAGLSDEEAHAAGLRAVADLAKAQKVPTQPKPAKTPRGTAQQFANLEKWKANELGKIEREFAGFNDPRSNTAREVAKQRVYDSYDQQQLSLGGGPNPQSGGPQKGERRTYQGVPYTFDGSQWVRQ